MGRAGRTSDVLLVVSTLVIAAALVHRELRPLPISGMAGPVFVEEWRTLAEIGRPIFADSAAVQIVEFADLECPFCKLFHERTRELALRMPGKVSVPFVHFPLSQHRSAMPAARAAECAAAEGKFPAFVDAAYSRQDSLGRRAWVRYALDAGIVDTVRFQSCFSNEETPDEVKRGVAAGKELLVRATPTVIINGWRFPGVPTDSLIEETIRRILAGKRPPGASRWP